MHGRRWSHALLVGLAVCTSGCQEHVDALWSPDAEVDAALDGGGTTPLGPLSTVTANHAIRSDGTLWAWGTNSFGLLGTGDQLDRASPVQIGTATDWVSVVGGTFFRLALKRDGRVFGWGLNQAGELGLAGRQIVMTPTPIAGATDMISIGAGDAHALAIKADRTVWAWGANDAGQCGRIGLAQAPAQVPGLAGARAVAGGNGHTLVIVRDGRGIDTVWAFGDNTRSELGVSGGSTHAPRQVAAMDEVTAIAAGFHVSAAIAGGTLYTWGSNDHLQVGSANDTQTVPFDTGVAATSVVITAYETLATRADGQLWGVGANTWGALDGMPGEARLQLVPITPVSGARVVSGMGSSTVLVLGKNRTLSWIGKNPFAVTGADSSTPQAFLANVRFPDDPI